MRQLDDLKPAEIKAKAAELAPALHPGLKDSELGHFEVRAALDPIAEALGSGRREPFVPTGPRGFAVQDRYAGRVQRALDQLAADGLLVKVPGRSKELPDGTPNYAGGVHYYTPEAFKAARAEGERAHAERIEKARRWADISIRLAKAGFVMNRDHRLTQDDWERLLGMANL